MNVVEVRSSAGKRIAGAAKEFYRQAHAYDYEHHVDLAWEHCYSVFHSAFDGGERDENLLCLNLACYLANWGMYRGSSFLTKFDYQIHTPIVELILDDRFRLLHGASCETIANDDALKLLFEVVKEMKAHYRKFRDKNVKKKPSSPISDVLITKILLGTFGCVPAYDSYFVAGLGHADIGITKAFNHKSIKALAKLYADNMPVFESARENMVFGNGLVYPQMKLLDMGIWNVGSKLLKCQRCDFKRKGER